MPIRRPARYVNGASQAVRRSRTVSNAPSILDRSYTITAEVTIPEGGAEGMIVTLGGRFGGYGLYLSRTFNWWYHQRFFRRIGWAVFVLGLLLVWLGQYRKWSPGKIRVGKAVAILGLVGVAVVTVTAWAGISRGKPVFLYNFLDLPGQRFKWSGPTLSSGKHQIVFDFKYDGPGPAKGGTGVLSVDGKEVDRKTIAHTIPVLMALDETFDVGVDTRTPVDDLEYQLPFAFQGSIDKLTFDIGPDQMSAEDRQAAAELLARARD